MSAIMVTFPLGSKSSRVSFFSASIYFTRNFLNKISWEKLSRNILENLNWRHRVWNAYQSFCFSAKFFAHFLYIILSIINSYCLICLTWDFQPKRILDIWEVLNRLHYFLWKIDWLEIKNFMFPRFRKMSKREGTNCTAPSSLSKL